MLIQKKEIIIYKINDKMPFEEWRHKLEIKDQQLIKNRLDRIRVGNYGDYKSVGDGVLELRFNQGFRIYFTEIANIIVLLLCGGNKSSQPKDIKQAKEYKKLININNI